MAAPKANRGKAAKRRLTRSALLRRWPVVVVLGLAAFLYYRPLTTYVEARGEVARAEAEVRALEARERRLERTLAARTTTQALVREARRLGYVSPGERLFVVKGIPEWRQARQARRAQAGRREASSIGGDG